MILRHRLVSGVVAVGLGAVFVLAALLVPAEAGHGTHTQLGLGSCTFLQLSGLPCPMCGATTSFSLMAHLQPVAALMNQPFASVLFMISAGAFGVAVSETVDPRGRWSRISRWLGPREGYLALGFLGVMGASWIYKIWLMGA